MPVRRGEQGFTLAEIAVSFCIIALLLGGAMMTLNAQVEQRNHDETLRRLNGAAEAIVAYAIVNRRLPCPARYTSELSHSQGMESFCTNATAFPCAAANETTVVQPAGNCSNPYDGFVPAASVGATPVDNLGFGLDPWGNRLRYAVSRLNTGCTTAPPANTRILTSQANLKTYGIGCLPNDLDVCTTSACAARVVSANTAVFVVYSTGKNGALAADPVARPNENENLDNDAVFVQRPPDPAGAAGGEFDDLLVVVPVGLIYSRLIAAGILP